MRSKTIIPGKIVTADKENNILTGHAVEISNGFIKKIYPYKEIEKSDGEIFFFPDLVMIPGFVQTHIHLCQTLFRGMADDMQLLDWLKYKIFPLENAHNADSLRASVRLGLYELLRSGTTIIMDMGTLRHQEVIFDELIKSGIRAFAGKCMMDFNDLVPEFAASTKDEINYTCDLASAYHNKNERIKYAFSPRFVLTSTEGLLKEAGEMMKDYEGSLYHTHSSENKNECGRVNELFGCDNIEYFNRIGVLSERTVLAHCVHVSDMEVNILAEKQVGVAHCPSSNLKLGSGIAKIPQFLQRGVKVSLGSDGAACSNTLDMFNEMRTASLIQKPFYGPVSMDALTMFRMATIEGARALNLQDFTGSIEAGKKADLVLLNLNRYNNSAAQENLYSDIVFSAGNEAVEEVMIDGEWVVRNSEPLYCDEASLLYDARLELERLKGRL